MKKVNLEKFGDFGVTKAWRRRNSVDRAEVIQTEKALKTMSCE